MGLFITKLVSMFGNSEPAKLLMLGLDAAGKTTILYKFKLNETISTIPTIGFNVETVQPVKGVTFTVWDVGGQDKIRALWKPYFNGTEGLLFIVDSSDRQRMPEAKYELMSILESEEMRDVPVVIMANKQDLPRAMKPHEIIDSLDLRSLTSHRWHIQATCAANGDGLVESMETMSQFAKDFKKGRR